MQERLHSTGTWSLRGRVLLLAGSAVLLLLVTLGILIAVLRSTQTTLVNAAAEHLERVAVHAAATYQARTSHDVNLASMEQPTQPPPPEPTMHGDLPPAPPPDRPGRHGAGLGVLMEEMLRLQPGIDGGFYRAATDQLGGYASSVQRRDGPDRGIPPHEQNTVRDLAHAAAASMQPQHIILNGPHDVIILASAPLCDESRCTGQATGALWLMQRLPGAESDRRRAILWSAFGFGLLALLVVAFAFAVLSEVDGSVRTVLARLQAMESSLDPSPVPSPASRMVEFQSVLAALENLASTLRAQRETERSLQARLQQQERLAAIGQLAAGVAHELRNPLATIRLRAQLAQRSPDLQASSRNSAVVLSEVDRLDGIIQRLLTFARPVRLERETVDLAQLCHETALRWTASGAAANRVPIRCEAPAAVYADVDAGRIRQVLDNLVENAIHASPEQSPGVELHCEEAGGFARLSVRDDGGGFSEEAMHRAVEPFFTTRASGTGLGLSIVYEIVHAHHGELKLVNRPEGGAKVEVLLPLSPADMERANG